MASKGTKPKLGKVLVIGGCGFLGHHNVNLLIRSYDASVAVIDLRCTNWRRPEADGVKYIEADITDAARLVAAFEEIRPEVVIHTASPIPQANSVHSNSIYKKVNVDGTQNVVDACKKTNVKVLVYTSSASVMSDNKSDLINASEEYPVIRGKAQTEYYSETKVCSTFMATTANILQYGPTNSHASSGRSRRTCSGSQRPRRAADRRDPALGHLRRRRRHGHVPHYQHLPQGPSQLPSGR